MLSRCHAGLLALALVPLSWALDPRQPLENYVVRRWDTEDGLPENGGKSLLQTRDGYLWIGTTQGVVRFDGLRFTVFAEGNATGLVEDRDGTLWIGTTAGLVRYRDRRFVRYGVKDGLRTDMVSALGEGPDGSVWVAGKAGVTRWFRGALLNDIDTTGLDLTGVRSITTDAGGNTWLATGIQALRYSDGKFIAFGAAHGLPPVGIQKILTGPAGKVWVVTQSGLFRFDGVRFNKHEADLASERVNVSLFDRDGNLWVGSARGLDRITGNVLSHFALPEAQALGAVDSLLEDREGTLWVGSSSGIYRINNRRGVTWWKEQGMHGTLTLAVNQSRDGSIWISSWDGGVVRIQGERTTTYRAGAPLSHDNVTCIYEAPDGSMWLGNRGSSLDHLEGERVTTYVYPDGVATSRYVTAMHADDHGDLLLGIAARGLFRLRGGVIEPVPEAPDLIGSNVWIIHRTGDGRLLIGTRDGIYQRENDRSWTRVPLPELGRSPARALHEDANGDIWLCTNGNGLVRWTASGTRTYTSREGLLNDMPSGIVDDGIGSFWISAAGGIARFPRSELDAVARGEISQLTPLVLGRADGLLSASSFGQVGAPQAKRLQDGTLLFATAIGVAAISPQDIRVNPEPPTVVIESVLADGEPMVFNEDSGVVIRPRTNRIELRFTAPSLTVPERQRFRYRLVGSDPTWIDAGHARVASYTHLAPGSYDFSVLASNNDGVWAKAPATLRLIARPSFYQTLWFKTLGVGMLVGAIRYWSRRNLKRKLEAIERQHALEKERARIARDMHDDLGGTLTNINFAVQRLRGTCTAENAGVVEVIDQRVRQLALELDRVVWTVNPKNGSLDQLAEFMARFARQFFADSPIQCRVKGASELPARPVAPDCQHHLLAMMKEMLNNVARHSQAKEVLVELSYEGGEFRLLVRDNGIGFDAGAEQRFGANGLFNLQTRAAEVGGTLEIVSARAEGTVVQLRVPLHSHSHA